MSVVFPVIKKYIIEIQVLWGVTLYEVVNRYWHFGGVWCLYLQVRMVQWTVFVTGCCFFCWYCILILKAKIAGFDCLGYDIL